MGISSLRNCMVQLVDPDDNSGDALLPLSSELLDELGWGEGDELVITLDEDTGAIVISLNERS